MFDIGFTELLIIATIVLLVLGPERLPETVRAVSLWIGRLKRSLRETRREIEKQVGADDVRRELHNEEVMRSLNNLRSDVDYNLNEELNGGNQSRSSETQEPAGETSDQAADPPTGPGESTPSENSDPDAEGSKQA